MLTSEMRQCKKCRKKFPATGDFFVKVARLPGGIRRVCKKCQAKYARAWNKRNPKAYLAAAARWRAANIEKAREGSRTQHRKIRDAFIAAYGGKCKCCGERESVFLTLEHVGGGGGRHRKKFGGNYGVLRELKKRGWPQKGFALLCHNCNHGERVGGCPHRKKLNNEA